MITSREHVLGRIADHLVGLDRPLRVAVDGITASGKTTLARELTSLVAARGRSAAHLSMDGFHNPRAIRHRLGRSSADGYYLDAYDFASFARLVLEPLGPGGDRRYRSRIIDLRSDAVVDEPPVLAPDDLVLVVDGSFLQRDLEWDEVVFVDTPFEVAFDRGTRRDAELLGGLEEASRAFEQRYHAASRRYLEEVGPVDRASVVVGNSDVTRPVLRRIGGSAGAVVNLFSYGTSQTAPVQIEHFGRTLVGKEDVLPGHHRVTTDRHPIVSFTGDPADSVAGTVLEVTTAELAAADIHEVDEYRRTLVTLGSGAEAWVYLRA
ncbi:gamma-glutamylcyclotransferase [Lentzea albida]|uniref:Uridine kinase n=1 Tax=Lentzea albida TaxID=65499 RepID=A0A1H9E187_9PSEU|nr:gamma-glutamylcyclotransferase [Lentzea albida]SEQ19425.1 Uridine kinase [Lentzea albida]